MDKLNNSETEDNSSAYHYNLTDAEIREMLQRKDDYLSGKVKSTPWSEIKKRYEET